MGKASSAKKVQRAAKVGGTSRVGKERKWGFPLAIGAIVVVFLGLIVVIRDDTVSQAAVEPRLGKDHWHNAYGVWTCDAFEPNLVDTAGDKYGIHTHEDGLIHIHPTTGNASGENAKLGRFTEEIGVEFGDDSFTLPNGDEYVAGEDCNGEAGVVKILRWPAGKYEEDPEVFTEDFEDLRFTGDGDAWAIVFAPESAFEDMGQFLPPSLAGINDVSDLAPGEEAPNVSVPDHLVTVPPDPTATIPDLATATTTPGETPGDTTADTTADADSSAPGDTTPVTTEAPATATTAG